MRVPYYGGLSSPEKGQCQGTFPRDSVEGRHEWGVFVLSGDYASVFVHRVACIPSHPITRIPAALGRVHNG